MVSCLLGYKSVNFQDNKLNLNLSSCMSLACQEDIVISNILLIIREITLCLNA